MREISTLHGPLKGVDSAAFWPDGTPKSVIVTEENLLSTSAGRLAPLYLPDEKRHPRVEPIQFHPNGQLRALPLQHQTPVPTPLGPVMAELVTFYPSGALCRVFPLNGKLSGFWTWRDERALAQPMRVETPQGHWQTTFINVHFFENGALASITLWPEETVSVNTPLGPVTARIGAAFHENGQLRSVEPASPWEIDTPIGRLTAFDPDPEGISGDANSVVFTPDGSLASLVCPGNTVTVVLPDGASRHFAPARAENLCGDGQETPSPLRVAFAPGEVRLGEHGEPFALAACRFVIGRNLMPLTPASFPCGDG